MLNNLGWQPIETAPKDNCRPLYLASFNSDTGELMALDWDGSWESESESWEIPQIYYYWASANGSVEEPTHWAYQDGPPPVMPTKFNIICETKHNGITGSCYLPVIRSNIEDDGSVTVVTPYWPRD